MNVIVNAKDSITPKYKETQSDWKNHFISRVIFNTDRELYIVVENSRGTVSDNEAKVYVLKSKEDFSFENDVIYNFAPYIRYDLKIGVLKVLENILDKFVDEHLKLNDDIIEKEFNHYKKGCDLIENHLYSIYKWKKNMFTFPKVINALRDEYKHLKYWDIKYKLINVRGK